MPNHFILLFFDTKTRIISLLRVEKRHPKLPFYENCFWSFIRHVWFRQGLTGIGCMMLSCKNQLPSPTPSPPLERNDQDGLHGEKLYNQSFPSPSPLRRNRELLMIHGTSGNRKMADQNEMFLSLVYICVWMKKNNNNNKRTNKSNCICYLCRMELLWGECHLQWDWNRRTIWSHDDKKCYQGKTQKKLTILKTSSKNVLEKRTHNPFNAQVNIYFMKTKLPEKRFLKFSFRNKDSNFVKHSYDYRPSWTLLGPITIINYFHFEITGDPYNQSGSQQCNLFTNPTFFIFAHEFKKLAEKPTSN